MVYRIAPGDAVRPDPGRRPAFGLLENQGKGEIKDSSGKTSSLPPPLDRRRGRAARGMMMRMATPPQLPACMMWRILQSLFFPRLDMLPAPDALISVQKTVILRFMVKFSAFVFVREGKVS